VRPALAAISAAVIGNAIIDPSGASGGKQRDAARGLMPGRSVKLKPVG
jgi:hypothetical protein